MLFYNPNPSKLLQLSKSHLSSQLLLGVAGGVGRNPPQTGHKH